MLRERNTKIQHLGQVYELREFLFSGQSTKRGEGVKDCPLRTFFWMFSSSKFVAVLLTTKPRGGGGA